MLIGQYEHTIDVKKRLALPSKFRKEIGKTVVITKGLDNCLVVYSLKKWKEESERYGRLPTISQAEARGFSRFALGGAMELNLDKLGRILVPDYLKKYAALKKEVVICGLSDKLEIWDLNKWNVYQKKMEKGISKLASKLGSSGI